MKRVISFVLVFVVVFGMVSTGAFASEESVFDIDIIAAAREVVSDEELTVSAENEAEDAEEAVELQEETDTEVLAEPVDVTVEADVLLADVPVFRRGEEDDVVDCIREALISRDTSVVFSYVSDEYTFDEAQSFAADKLALDFWEDAKMHTGDPLEGDSIAWQFESWKVYSSFGSKAGVVTYTFTYSFTYYTTAEQEAELTLKVERLMDELGLRDLSKTDYEKLCIIYDYLVKNVEYDYTHLNNTKYKLKYSAYAALCKGTSVCQGYALALYRLALECGIDCRFIMGTSKSKSHAWNIVELEGEYYLLDATWDSTEGNSKSNYKYFLRGSKKFSDHTSASDSCISLYDVSKSDYDPSTAMLASGTCGTGLSWTLSPEGVLAISGNGAMQAYEAEEDVPWHSRRGYIKSVVIGAGVTEISPKAFWNCPKLSKITVDAANDAYITDENGILYSKDMSVLLVCPGSYTGEFSVPEEVTRIEEGAFCGCAVTRIVISNRACAIGDDPNSLGDPDTTVVVGYGNTAVETYAKQYGYKFLDMDMTGDLVVDGELHSDDLIRLMKMVVGEFVEEEKADINDDGAVDILDVICLVMLISQSVN